MSETFAHLRLMALVAGVACPGGPASAQGFFEFLRNSGTSSYAPAEEARVAPVPTTPLSIVPVNPRAGDVLGPNGKKRPEAKSKVPRITTPVPVVQSEEEDEDANVLYEHDEPKRVKVALPTPRPGAVQRNAEDVAPVGSARWSNAQNQPPPGVDFREAATLPPSPTRLASLPSTSGNAPSWTTDAPQLRPTGLRESETPVPDMPGVYAPPEANFQCLPDGVKQVLLDTAARFGHVAILNAKRPRGTGARASYHYQCRAVDFRVRGVAVSTVYAYLREHPNVGGRKIYPFGFFHVDDGPARSW